MIVPSSEFRVPGSGFPICRLKLETPNLKVGTRNSLVAPGVSPAVEPGFQPGGSRRGCGKGSLEFFAAPAIPWAFFRVAGRRPLRQARRLTPHTTSPRGRAVRASLLHLGQNRLG